MTARYTDEVYDILDELNAQVEDMFNQSEDPQTIELMMSMFSQKARDFMDDLEREREKLDLIAV